MGVFESFSVFENLVSFLIILNAERVFSLVLSLFSFCYTDESWNPRHRSIYAKEGRSLFYVMSCHKVSNIVRHSLGLIVVDQVASWDPTSKNKHMY